MDKKAGITSQRIKDLRIKKGFTMEKLAELIGVSKSTIAKWENGYVSNMRQDKVDKLANIFNVPPTYLLGYGDESSISNEQQFVALYSQLNERDKALIDGMLTTLISKQ